MSIKGAIIDTMKFASNMTKEKNRKTLANDIRTSYRETINDFTTPTKIGDKDLRIAKLLYGGVTSGTLARTIQKNPDLQQLAKAPLKYAASYLPPGLSHVADTAIDASVEKLQQQQAAAERATAIEEENNSVELTPEDWVQYWDNHYSELQEGDTPEGNVKKAQRKKVSNNNSEEEVPDSISDGDFSIDSDSSGGAESSSGDTFGSDSSGDISNED